MEYIFNYSATSAFLKIISSNRLYFGTFRSLADLASSL